MKKCRSLLRFVGIPLFLLFLRFRFSLIFRSNVSRFRRGSLNPGNLYKRIRIAQDLLALYFGPIRDDSINFIPKLTIPE